MKKLALCTVALTLCAGALAPQAAVAQEHNPDRYDRNYDQRDRYRDAQNNGRLPREYLRGRYDFDGWRQRGLAQPARGQTWIRVCDSFILASTRTGDVVEVHVAGRGRVDRDRGWDLSDALDCRGRGDRRDRRARYRDYD